MHRNLGRRLLLVLVLALIAAGSTSLYLAAQNAEMSYRLADLKQQEERLRAQRNLLRLERKSLRDPAGIEQKGGNLIVLPPPRPSADRPADAN